ncbi:MAG: VOC family protein [Verrucomicrobiota bacterium]
MKITLTSIPVQDQARALAFYTEKLGFEKKEDIPMGEHRWLTVISPEGVTGVELLLEPLGFEPAKDYYKSLYESGIPATQFESEDLDREIDALKARGVVFRGEAQEMDGAKFISFEDTCGNLICLVEKKTEGGT